MHAAMPERPAGIVAYFNHKAATAKREPGRFDSIAGDFGYLYAAETELTVFAEVFLRGDTVTSPSTRVVPRRRLDGLRLSRLIVERPLSLVSLVGGEHLSRVVQDAWLTSCDEADYGITERYGRSIREWAPRASGLTWLSKRDNAHRAYVLFDDRITGGSVTGRLERNLDAPGDPYPVTMLARLSVSLEDPLP
jgi:RES domain